MGVCTAHLLRIMVAKIPINAAFVLCFFFPCSRLPSALHGSCFDLSCHFALMIHILDLFCHRIWLLQRLRPGSACGRSGPDSELPIHISLLHLTAL